MANKQPLPQYVLKKAVQLNGLDAKQKKLMLEISNWMNLSGYSFSEITDEEGIIMKLVDGQFDNEEAIRNAFEKLMESQNETI